MAEITASMVKELREKTDAPMMECKKALTEAAGDLGKAEEILRVRLGNKASKAAGRVAAEGVVAVFIAPDAKLGAIIEVNCETDFVAKNEDFLAFARNLAEPGGRARAGRRGGAVGAAAGWLHRGSGAHGAGRQDRREHVDPALRAHAGQRPLAELRAWRRQDRRAGGRDRRRRGAGQGPRHAHRRQQAGGAVQGRGVRPS